MAQTNILLESGTNELEIVEFFIDEPGYRGYYGINVAKVVEIIRMQKTTAMPQMRHPAVMGAFPHRDGKVIPLVNLAKYLDKETTSLDTKEAKIIVTEFNHVVTGFMVSGVNRIHRLSWNEVEEPGGFLQNVSHSSITGVVRLEGRVVFILDMENVVGDLDSALSIRFNQIPEPLLNTAKVYTILHADDSNSVRKLVKNLLEKSGQFQLIQTPSGQEAWDLLLEKKRHCEEAKTSILDEIQAVISDIEMPRMDGLTLCKHIKDDPELKVLPVALFSSLITGSLEHKGISVGADAQFAKPDLQTLSESLLGLIAKSQAKS